jgi:hypothetical protein
MAKMPAFQFYPGDWRKDVGVQSLSFHDRGVWWEMLCLMHESERRGVLVLNGQAMNEEVLARLLGLDKQTFITTLTTLLTSGVASREPETGAIMSRRMVRDEKLREIRIEAGKMGGNPALLNQNKTTHDNQTDNQMTPPSSSSSVSSSTTKTKAKSFVAKNATKDSSNGKPLDDSPDFQLTNDFEFEESANQTNPRKKTKPEVDKAIREVFVYYLDVMNLNPATYTLTPKRRQKGLSRLAEALRIAHGNLNNAVELMKGAVDELATSDWHMGRDERTNGKRYCDWENHLFRNTEQFEKWLQQAQDAAAREAKHV